jgi:hypothetical protein
MIALVAFLYAAGVLSFGYSLFVTLPGLTIDGEPPSKNFVLVCAVFAAFWPVLGPVWVVREIVRARSAAP